MASSDHSPAATNGAGRNPLPPRETPNPPQERSWALVTGATGGIGAEFARYLAAHGSNLVLTGRNTVKLGDLARELGGTGAQLILLPVDLADRGAREKLFTDLTNDGIRISTLVNNAGFALLEDVVDSDPDELLELLEVNVVALTHLSRMFLPGMLEAGQGTIINVASTASYQAMPGFGAYGASKAYVRSFSTALWAETKGTGVRVVCISPGPVHSNFWHRAGNDKVMRNRRQPRHVVETTFAALNANRPVAVDGRWNRMLSLATRVVPQSLAAQVGRFVVSR